MSCYHPMLGVQSLTPNENGNYPVILKGPYNPERASAFENSLLIPCGKCIGCRLDYSRQWADRMIYELDHHNGKGIFITLTYNNAHVPVAMLDNETDLPISFTLDKSDLQKFWKRLRKKLPDKRIRYYACGEYGTKTFRPHYHAIIFGISVSDLTDRRLIGVNKLKQEFFTSDLLQEAWSIYQKDSCTYDPIGYVLFSDVSWETCAYVARYVMKKVGDDIEQFNAWRNVDREFTTCSRRPGIGAYYYSDHGLTYDTIEKIYRNGKPIEIPKYILEKMSLNDPDGYDRLKKIRIEYANDKMLMDLFQTDLDFEELNLVKEEKILGKTRALNRCTV